MPFFKNAKGPFSKKNKKRHSVNAGSDPNPNSATYEVEDEGEPPPDESLVSLTLSSIEFDSIVAPAPAPSSTPLNVPFISPTNDAQVEGLLEISDKMSVLKKIKRTFSKKKKKSHSANAGSDPNLNSATSEVYDEGELHPGESLVSLAQGSVEFDSIVVPGSAPSSTPLDDPFISPTNDVQVEGLLEPSEDKDKERTVTEHQTYSESASISSLGNKKSKGSIKRDSDVKLREFISNPECFDLTSISDINSSLHHHNNSYLLDECGYNQTIVNLVAVMTSLNGSSCDNIESLLSTYGDINKRRLEDSEFYNFVERNATNILSIPEKVGVILKEKADSSLICMECQRNIVSILYIPCGHIVLCDQCHSGVKDVCGCCGSIVRESHHIFL